MKISLASVGIVAAVLVSAQGAMSAEILTKSRANKGYVKRDRVFPVSSQTVSPSQLHEVYGPRVDAGVEITRANSKINGDKVVSTAPSAAVRGAMAGDILALGLAAGRSENAGKAYTDMATKERAISNKIVPSVAVTLVDHVTVGVSSESNWVALRQNDDAATERQFTGYSRREAVGLSVHYPKWEAGLMHTTASVSTYSSKDSEQSAQTGFALAAIDSSDSRAAYSPAANSFFARGNVTPNWSLQGALTHVEYDSNVDGAKDFLFEDYRRDDRLSGQAQVIYWLDDEATRFAGTVSYRGATYAPFGTEELSLGYRDANLYGAAFDAIFEVSPKTYIGGRVSHLRGERNQDAAEGLRVSVRESRTNIGTTVSKSF